PRLELILSFYRYKVSYLVKHCSFFFQAEDGIRDFHVTGVQTCALPIYRRPGPPRGQGRLDVPRPLRPEEPEAARRPLLVRAHVRSEERRVGKECSSRWTPSR